MSNLINEKTIIAVIKNKLEKQNYRFIKCNESYNNIEMTFERNNNLIKAKIDLKKINNKRKITKFDLIKI
jgi:hypothetical protein